MSRCHCVLQGCAVQLKECPVCRTLATGVNKKEFLGRTYAYYDVEEISRASSSIFHDATESFTTISVPTLTIPGGTDIVNRVQERPIPWAPPTYVLDLQ